MIKEENMIKRDILKIFAGLTAAVFLLAMPAAALAKSEINQ
jgi:hypothetical protein